MGEPSDHITPARMVCDTGNIERIRPAGGLGLKTVRLKCVVKMQHSDVAGDEQVLTFGNTEQAGDALVRSISCGQTP